MLPPQPPPPTTPSLTLQQPREKCLKDQPDSNHYSNLPIHPPHMYFSEKRLQIQLSRRLLYEMRCRIRTFNCICCYSVPSMRTDVAELFYDVLRSTMMVEPHLISAPSSRTSAMRWDGMGDDCHKVGYIVHKVTDFRAQQHEIPKLLL